MRWLALSIVIVAVGIASFGRTGSVLSSAVIFAAEPASQTTTSPAGSRVDDIRVEAEKLKAEAEVRKIADARLQFFMDWGFKVGLAIAALVLLAWLLPQVSEISVPWGTGTLSFKRARKETLPIEASPPAPQPALAETAELLKKTLVPGPATERLVDRVEEADVYQRAGLRRDEIYVCHHAKKMPRSEYWHVRIYVDAETAEILNKVEKVVYRLHPTFVQTERTQTNRSEQFALEITAWGEFMLYANVYFAGIARPIELKRYLNF